MNDRLWIEIEEAIARPAGMLSIDILAFDEALTRLAAIDSRKARVLEFWFFAGMTVEEIAHTMGKSRPHIANTLRLLDLPDAVREMIRRDELSAGHGRQLLSFPDPEAMAARVVAEKLSVRDLEKLAAGQRLKKSSGGGKAAASATKSADTRALEKRIEEALGLKASLAQRGGEKTVLTLEIDNYDQLDSVVDRLTRR